MPGNRSRRKGSAAERELASEIYSELGVLLQRRLDQPRSSGHDLELHPDEHGPVAAQVARYSIEVKRASKASPHQVVAWWGQTFTQAAAVGRTPCLVYREDRQDWRFVVPLQAIHPGMPAPAVSSVDWCATLNLRGWAVLIRETA